MFILKKIISQSLSPVSLCLELLIIGLAFLLFTRKQKTGKVIISVSVTLFVVFSYTPIPGILLRSLEYRYPLLSVTTVSDTTGNDAVPSVKWIVVLGGGHTSDPNIPTASQLSRESLIRLIEAIRLYKKIPGSKLILSEGKVFDPIPGAETMSEVARAMGVNREDMILESESRDTVDEARLIKPIVGDDEFILVTSASHIPRSLGIFKKFGMYPIPAPVGHRTKYDHISPGSFFPDSGGFIKTESVLHEYMGIIWAKLRGHM